MLHFHESTDGNQTGDPENPPQVINPVHPPHHPAGPQEPPPVQGQDLNAHPGNPDRRDDHLEVPGAPDQPEEIPAPPEIPLHNAHAVVEPEDEHLIQPQHPVDDAQQLQNDLTPPPV